MQPARTLDQIVSEIRGVYDPQIKAVKQKQSLLPQMIASEEQGLGAKQEQAFGDILSGARRRGLGFSGIPVGEQAKYTATEYLPALARLRQSGQEQAMTLEQAILGIQEKLQNQALGLRQYEQQRYDTWQQQQEQMEFQREQARRAAAASSASGSWMNSLMGGGQTQGAMTPQEDPGMQEVVNVIGSRDYMQLYQYYKKLTQSAGAGNQGDARKLEYLAALQPGLFKDGKLNTARLNNLMNARAGVRR